MYNYKYFFSFCFMAIIPTDCIPALAWEGRLRFFLYLLTAGGYVKGRNERELKK